MKRTLILVFMLVCVSCDVNWEVEQKAAPTVVVEGWIETGKPAAVILSRLLPFVMESGNEEEFDMNEFPLLWATVKISDGENEEMLVGMYDDDYVPPYVYRGSGILGEEGKTYTLSVRYPGVEVTAETTMPKKVEIERVDVEPNSSNPEESGIRIHFKDDESTTDYYKVFTMVKDKDTRFYSSLMGYAADDAFKEGRGSILVNRAFRHVGMEFTEFSPYFSKDETVRVKLAHLSKDGYDFWYSFENDIANASNVLFPSTSGLKSNIHGGNGIWCAYAVDIVDVDITP